MGLFDRLFHRQPKSWRYAPPIDGYSPLFPQFGTNIYASDVVQQVLKCIADEMKKLNPMHIRIVNSDPVPAKSNIQDVLDEPNPLMSTTEFIEKIVYLLLMNYNAFIVPIYHTWTDETTGATRRYYDALYPVLPTQVNFIEDASGELFVQFLFMNGYETTLPYSDVIHIRYNYSVNAYMGGNVAGQPEHEALLKTLELNGQLLNGIAKAMNASYAVNGIVKINTLLSNDDTERELERFNQMLRKSESGFVPLDLKADVTPFKREAQIVDDNTLKFIDEKILRTWGIPRAILDGDYTSDQYAAFYQRALEPLVKAFSQAFTKKMFTSREKAFGNRIEFYPKELIFMSTQQTLEAINILAPQGGGYVNEYRTWLGLRPLPELAGKRYMSLNWVDADKAAEYQLGENADVEVIDEEKEEI